MSAQRTWGCCVRCCGRPGRACKSSLQQRSSQAAPGGVGWPQAVLLKSLQAGSLHPCLHTAGSWCSLHCDLQSAEEASEDCLQHSLLAMPPKGTERWQPPQVQALLAVATEKARLPQQESGAAVWPCMALADTPEDLFGSDQARRAVDRLAARDQARQAEHSRRQEDNR